MLDYISIMISWSVAFILFGAAWGKLESFSQFKLNLVTSFGLSKSLAGIVTPSLITLELSIAFIIISHSAYSYFAMIVAFTTFCIFTLFLIYHWSRDARIKCNCFGQDDRPVSIFDLLRNLVIVLFIGTYLILGKSDHALSIEEQPLLAGLGVGLSIVVIHLHDIALLFLSARGKV